jgi:Predicted O-methyltransferase
MRLLDLGTGCGPVALTMLCRFPFLTASGIDCQTALVEAARTNARRIGFGNSFTGLCGDLTESDFPPRPGSFELVLANPPYRQPARGRLPANRLRRVALFETAKTIPAFLGAARQALCQDGRFGILFPAPRLRELVGACSAHGLTPLRIIQVHSYADTAPRVILLEAVRCLNSDNYQKAIEESSIIIHTRDDSIKKTRQHPVYTEEALRYCPFLTPSSL